MGTSAAKRQAWIDHIAAWSASGQTQRAYCAAQGLSYHAFDYWRRFVLKQNAPSTPSATFIPLVASAPPASVCGGVIEVRLVGGAHLVWPDARLPNSLSYCICSPHDRGAALVAGGAPGRHALRDRPPFRARAGGECRRARAAHRLPVLQPQRYAT